MLTRSPRGESSQTPRVTTRQDYDHLFKLLLIGDSGVGKSSLLVRFAEDRFTPSHITTIGVDFKIRTLDVANQRVKIQIWDTAGQERFRTITSTYYRSTHGVMVVYDVTSSESYSNVKRWLHEVSECCDRPVCILLVGNKDDDPSRKVVQLEDAGRFADLMGVRLMETSAKENRGVEEAFRTLVLDILEEKRVATSERSARDVVRLGRPARGRWRAVKKAC